MEWRAPTEQLRAETIMGHDDLLDLTTHVVAAHVASNQVAVKDLPKLIASVHRAMTRLGRPATPAPVKPEPAVAIRASVRPDAITCLECGKKYRMIRRHLLNEHRMTTEAYRAKWKLSPTYPMTAPSYSSQRADLARQHGLGRRAARKLQRQARLTDL